MRDATKPESIPDTSSDDDTDSDSDITDQQPEQWVSIPLSIKDSSVNDQLSLRSIGLACALDISRSTFEGLIDIQTTTFMADLIAEGSTFKSGIQSQGTDFKKGVMFRRAKFIGNFESTPATGHRPIFEGDVDFREAVFSRLASFLGSSFSSHMDFRYAQFGRVANFGGAKLGTGPARALSGAFYMAEFNDSANFRNARFTQLRFWRTVFRNGADFHASKGRGLQLLGVSLTGPLAFDDAIIAAVEFNGYGGSMVIDGDTDFRRATLEKLTFNQMAFKKTVDLEEASVSSNVTFRAVSFDGDLHLEDSAFPTAGQRGEDDSESKKREISIRDITLNKGLYVDAEQFLDRSPWWALWREDRSRFYSDDESAGPDGAASKDDRRI